MDYYAAAPDYAYGLVGSASCLSKANTDALPDAAYSIAQLARRFASTKDLLPSNGDAPALVHQHFFARPCAGSFALLCKCIVHREEMPLRTRRVAAMCGTPSPAR